MKPVAEPSPFSPEAVGQIAANFGLQGLWFQDGPHHGWGNLAFHLTARQGDFILRRPRDAVLLGDKTGSIPLRLREQHRLSQFLVSHSFPAVAPILAVNGNTVATIDGIPYSLHPYVKGQRMDLNKPAHIQRAATALATLHKLTAEYQLETTIVADPFPAMFQRRLKDFYERTETLGSSLSALGISGAVEFLRHSLPDIEESVMNLPYESLPKLAIHGDYRWPNLLFQDDRLVAVLDFDRSRCETRILDLVIAIADLTPGAYDKRFLASARLFFSAYDTVLPLEDSERNALPVMSLSRAVYDAFRKIRKISKRRHPEKEDQYAEKFRKHVKRLHWLQENWSAWRTTFVSALKE